MFLLVISLFTCSCDTTKSVSKLYTYWDVNNNQLTESEFKKIRSTNKYLDIKVDSLDRKELIERTETGNIKNIEVYRSLLVNKSSEEINPKKPIVVIYHPGEDPCNSSGRATKRSLREWHYALKTGVEKLNGNAPIYLYKENTGLEKYWKVVKWYKDPEGLTEKLFFKHNYTC